MNKYLLQTSTCSALMEDSPAVIKRLNSLTEADYLFTCPIVKEEILYGIIRLPAGKRQRDLQQKANELFAQIPCEPIPDNVADFYAKIKAAAERQGTPLDECDLWIAATALALDTILVTSDSDYGRIAGLGLRLENWVI